MTTTIKLPELGENVDSGEPTRILVSAGDTIPKDQSLLELETEKATIEVPSPISGVIFTITNLGGIGGTGFSPIVNYPEVAILGISRVSTEPRQVDGTFQPRKILPLSVSYDHRLIDGADAARFLRWVAEALEEPALLLFRT